MLGRTWTKFLPSRSSAVQNIMHGGGAVVFLAMSEQVLAAYMSTSRPVLHQKRFNTVKTPWNQ